MDGVPHPITYMLSGFQLLGTDRPVKSKLNKAIIQLKPDDLVDEPTKSIVETNAIHCKCNIVLVLVVFKSPRYHELILK